MRFMSKYSSKLTTPREKMNTPVLENTLRRLICLKVLLSQTSSLSDIGSLLIIAWCLNIFDTLAASGLETNFFSWL